MAKNHRCYEQPTIPVVVREKFPDVILIRLDDCPTLTTLINLKYMDGRYKQICTRYSVDGKLMSPVTLEFFTIVT